MTKQSEHKGHPFQVMAKPAGPMCNLSCAYCFYKHKTHSLHARHAFQMEKGTLELFVRTYIASQPDGYPVQFVWQGGEPTLCGVDFFRDALSLQEKLKRPGQVITNAFQTNAVLIDEQWAAFLKEHDFLVGVSIDGPADIHDHYRKDAAGGGSFDRVMAGLAHLKKHDAACNALCCVTDISVEDPLKIYGFLRDHFEFIQFIPVVEERNFTHQAPFLREEKKWQRGNKKKSNELVTRWSVSPEGWGKFLSTIFDEWVVRDVGRTFVQIFDATLACTLGQGAPLCIFGSTCGRALVMEHDGEVYSCDHFVYPQYKLANIRECSLEDIAASRNQIRFGQDKLKRLPRQCLNCTYLFLCSGGCPKNRFASTRKGEKELNYLCSGYQAYFSHTARAMQFMANELRNQRPAANVMAVAEKMIG
ncbi:MAG: anaerobic sulfatase maturase [Deltaproteobacteria bacterium]|nr:anaerobic sulfatase maturase [Deltaproteobacteria bacterium]